MRLIYKHTFPLRALRAGSLITQYYPTFESRFKYNNIEYDIPVEVWKMHRSKVSQNLINSIYDKLINDVFNKL